MPPPGVGLPREHVPLVSVQQVLDTLHAAYHYVRSIGEIRVLIMGTCMGVIKYFGGRVWVAVKNFFTARATVKADELAYHWVAAYLEARCAWKGCRNIQIVVRGESTDFANEKIRYPSATTMPANGAECSLWWRGTLIWVLVNEKDKMAYMELSAWSIQDAVLTEFIEETRKWYLAASVRPVAVQHREALASAFFNSNNVAYSWVTAYLDSLGVVADSAQVHVMTRERDLDSVAQYLPTQGKTEHLRWRGYWLQVDYPARNSNSSYEGTRIQITFHTTDRQVLHDFVDAARSYHKQHPSQRVSVYLVDARGAWSSAVLKARRALSSVILPGGIKESLLADAKEFLGCRDWYLAAGVPYRRGYLLHGEPGTGKSSTVHALAGELGLPIYVISLSAPGMDDVRLGQLIRDTQAQSIILLEDLDCAFPADEAKSQVTLAGLLNALDSVASQEGRLMFATANSIEQLDGALVRPGRMDVKVRYTLAASEQIKALFERFYPDTGALLAERFAGSVPANLFAMADLQGYLLGHKHDPQAAAEGVGAWVEAEKERHGAQGGEQSASVHSSPGSGIRELVAS
ncbi:p-loop containing nucleoside triphosphate hydrolase protein [Mycena kentingensis (nom. inval.)]|nr:p-loop containing nucleoside triphosphate hydrolase protein [Mycena kentingensis (nom. inval.)]